MKATARPQVAETLCGALAAGIPERDRASAPSSKCRWAVSRPSLLSTGGSPLRRSRPERPFRATGRPTRAGLRASRRLPSLPRGRRAGRPPLERRDPLQPDRRPRYFSEVAAAVPGLSDRLLSQRLRELESEGLVERAVHEGSPARVSYCLSERERRSSRRSAPSTTGRRSGGPTTIAARSAS